MTIGIWILGDRLTHKQLSLSNNQNNQPHIPVILIESGDYARQRPYHQQKLVLVWSAMRHFAEELKADGWQDFLTPLSAWIERHQITELQLTIPCDRPFAKLITSLDLDCKITFLPDNHFLWERSEFIDWSSDRQR